MGGDSKYLLGNDSPIPNPLKIPLLLPTSPCLRKKHVVLTTVIVAAAAVVAIVVVVVAAAAAAADDSATITSNFVI